MESILISLTNKQYSGNRIQKESGRKKSSVSGQGTRHRHSHSREVRKVCLGYKEERVKYIQITTCLGTVKEKR